jgi:hypothetical protein
MTLKIVPLILGEILLIVPQFYAQFNTESSN